MQRLAFRKIFNQFSHISYLLLIRFTTKFELQKSNYFCGFNINASEKKIILSLSLSLSFSLSKGTSFLTRVTLHVLAFYIITGSSHCFYFDFVCVVPYVIVFKFELFCVFFCLASRYNQDLTICV